MEKLKHPFFLLFLTLLLLSIPTLSLTLDPERAVLLGFDFSAGVFIVTNFLSLGAATPALLRSSAARNDAGRSLLLLVAATTLLVVLFIVGIELGQHRTRQATDVALEVLTLAIAWLFGNFVYALHYAHMYYDSDPGGDHGGLAFPGTDQPSWWDFCYFALVLGMTFQVSDVQILSKRIRRTVTVHSLVAFFFNIGVVALTVNIVASAI